MSIFGYPAVITHVKAIVDNWGRVSGTDEVPSKAKVIEEQKVIKNDKGEEVQSMIEVHLPGAHSIGNQDRILYTNQLGKEYDFRPLHYEVRKELGTDIAKKVIIYG
ncbi:hypothetical protein KP77_25040 [Jeotgalibacillus alimentarius]|uniref:Uncharacterized protein n=1 Tax=Jeotgalibacillus alimentarius TaxID=135826 RepID=A0A0C2R9C7_9BACL|nr:hypothetical protein [Jeotgalibacillus alimentarius]KIL46935.1 hypothetical protein KP77_25040 [Jeotgalibacillus alimentarius]